MPKKKSGAQKKTLKQKVVQSAIRSRTADLLKLPCNLEMTCDCCKRKQKNRAFCYFCNALQRLPMCAQCGKTKCTMPTGDCVVKHPGVYATGMNLIGCICDFCEAPVCHSKRCIKEHSCPCPLEDAICMECRRSVWNHGGRLFRCGICSRWLCEDDQFEHQASCEIVEADTYKCYSCNKIGIYTCTRCKICFCDAHLKSKLYTKVKKTGLLCKKCGFPVSDASGLSLSVKQHDFGRLQSASGDGDDFEYYDGGDDDDYGGIDERSYDDEWRYEQDESAEPSDLGQEETSPVGNTLSGDEEDT